MVAHRAQIEDLTQDSLVKMLEALPRFELDGKAKFSSWVLTIATRVCLDALRKSKRRGVVEEISDATLSEVDVERHVIAQEMRARVERAMERLPDDLRAILILRGYYDLDYDEIARALVIDESTVKSRLARARTSLKSLVDRGGA